MYDIGCSIGKLNFVFTVRDEEASAAVFPNDSTAVSKYDKLIMLLQLHIISECLEKLFILHFSFSNL